MKSSPYAIDGVINLGLYFNGVEFPFTVNSTLGIIHISESSKLEIPMCKVQITDGIGWLSSNPGALVEGALVTFVILARNTDSVTLTFRVNHLKTSSNKGPDVIDFDGYLDIPKYWIETNISSYQNYTSSQVLRELSSQVGLTYNGVDTQDSQNWFGNRMRHHQFCSTVASRGYLSDTSCMKRAVTILRELRYKDVSVLDNPKIAATIGSVRDGKLPIVSFLPKNSGGSANRRTVYSKSTLEYSTVRDSAFRIHNNVMITPTEGGEFNVNADVRSQVSQGHLTYAPIDYGNVNDNYQRALYQNRRGTDTFSVGLDIVTPVPTLSLGLSIFDIISVEAPPEMAEQTGLYVVVTRSIIIAQGSYHEKFELTRRSAASNQAKNTNSSNATEYEAIGSSLYTDYN